MVERSLHLAENRVFFVSQFGPFMFSSPEFVVFAVDQGNVGCFDCLEGVHKFGS